LDVVASVDIRAVIEDRDALLAALGNVEAEPALEDLVGGQVGLRRVARRQGENCRLRRAAYCKEVDPDGAPESPFELGVGYVRYL
jgi:hypothetical protein